MTILRFPPASGPAPALTIVTSLHAPDQADGLAEMLRDALPGTHLERDQGRRAGTSTEALAAAQLGPVSALAAEGMPTLWSVPHVYDLVVLWDQIAPVLSATGGRVLLTVRVDSRLVRFGVRDVVQELGGRIQMPHRAPQTPVYVIPAVGTSDVRHRVDAMLEQWREDGVQVGPLTLERLSGVKTDWPYAGGSRGFEHVDPMNVATWLLRPLPGQRQSA